MNSDGLSGTGGEAVRRLLGLSTGLMGAAELTGIIVALYLMVSLPVMAMINGDTNWALLFLILDGAVVVWFIANRNKIVARR
jgi:hypothetical protein